MNPYADTARAYLDGGWSPVPVPLGAKGPPPSGYTGRSARKQVTADAVERWSAGEPRNVALVLPADVVGIDVDAYAGKAGAASLSAAEAAHGPLPPTWIVTSRDDGVSGIRLYRVPSGSTFAGDVGPGIDVVQAGHRYAVVWPSVHPSGSVYRWQGPDGTERPSVPYVADLPDLPDAWLTALASGGSEAVSEASDPLSVADAQGWLSTFAGGQPCRPVAEARDTAVRSLDSNRHDTMTAAVWQLVSLGAEGHRGVRRALRSIRDAFLTALAGDRDDGPAEYARALLSAARKVDSRTAEPCRCPATAEAAPVPTATGGRFRIGRDALTFDGDEQPALWGPADTPLWARGESLMLVGPPSVGKSTLAQLLVLARIGLRSEVLGYPVADDGGSVLYVAADRPRQIARGIRRMVELDAAELRRFVMWHGPLDHPISAEAHQRWLTERAQEYGATTIVIDSLKDVLPNLSDEVGAGGYNLARQHALASGVEWIEIHHNRKSNGDNRAPRQLDDVYGNRLITAGAGSVISLWGQSGEREIMLTHLKPLGDRHSTTKLILDGATGDIDTVDGVDSSLAGALMFAGSDGLTPSEAAREVYGEHWTRPDADRLRKRLARMAERGELTAESDGRAVRYYLVR